MLWTNLAALLLLVGVLAALTVSLLDRQRYRRGIGRVGMIEDVGRLNATVDVLLRRNEELQAEVRELQRDLEKTRVALSEAQERIRLLEANVAVRASQPALLIAEGDQAAFDVDLARLREVKTHTGLDFYRLRPVTKESFRTALARRRVRGCPYRYVHMAAHVMVDEAAPDPAGRAQLMFADGPVDAVWLSGVLADVEVLMLAGCRSDQLGSLLGVVPWVVTLAEELSHEDAMDMTLVFWEQIGRGRNPEQAFAEMRRRCPAVAEYAELHR